MLDDAGLKYRSAGPLYYRAAPDDEAEFRDTIQKKTDLIEAGWTFVVVDQSSKYVGTESRRGWYRIGYQPRRLVWITRTKVTTTSAVIHEGESLYLWTEEYQSSEHGIEVLQSIIEDFG